MPSYEELLEENSELRRRVVEQERRIGKQEGRIRKLEELIEELRRRGKRQAAPFSKGKPKSTAGRPGRKPRGQLRPAKWP